MELELNRKKVIITPKGIFKVLKIFYRPDKFESIKSGIPVFKIKKNINGVQIPKNINYNCLIIKKLTVFMKIYSEMTIFTI